MPNRDTYFLRDQKDLRCIEENGPGHVEIRVLEVREDYYVQTKLTALEVFTRVRRLTRSLWGKVRSEFWKWGF